MMNDWIKNLKPGDEVIYSCFGDKSIEVVQKITPTGIVKTDMRSYNQYGSARGDYSGCIIECTPERKRELVEKSFVRQVVHQLRSISSLSYDKAVAIKKVLEQNSDYGIWVLEGCKIPYCSECGAYSDDAETRDASYCSNCGIVMLEDCPITISPVNKENGRMFGKWEYNYSVEEKAKPWVCNNCGCRRENPIRFCPKCNTDMHITIKESHKENEQ